MKTLEQVYQDAYRNRLVKIAKDNKIDPDKFVFAVEKLAAKPPVEAVKSFGQTVLESFKNLGQGIQSGAEYLGTKGKQEALKLKGPEKGWGKKREFKQQMSELEKQKTGQKEGLKSFGKSKAALGIIGGTGVLGAGGVALASGK